MRIGECVMCSHIICLYLWIVVHINQESEILENPFAGYEIGSVLKHSSSDTVRSLAPTNKYFE